ncbi:hypothetical protein L9F63_018716 [Diploptera punctata]|uniref:Zinc transporter ZIP3 n=1 Tax=Diploptera punctata TaxID=6984 RepID=A0AAD7ZW21_DIPPU|nr:hypothetical protein L9F63_018716 [Diploptera punctata]
MTTFSIIPVLLVRNRSNLHLSECVITWISFGNCIAGGVFLGMCFLGLFPYVNDKFTEVIKTAKITTTFPLSEFVIIIGFFLIFTVENFVISARYNMEKDNITSEDNVHMSHIASKRQFDDDESYVRLLENDGQEQDLSEDVKVSIAKPLQVSHSLHHASDGSSSKHSLGMNTHSHCDMTFAVNKSTGLRRVILLVALSIHSVFEGMMLGLQTDHVKLLHLFLAVLIHELLVALALGVNIAKLNLSLLKSLKYILIVTGSIPVGIVVGIIVRAAPGLTGAAVSAVLQGLAAGIFIHVTFMEIIPEELAGEKCRLLKIMFLFIGFMIMAVVNFILGAH